MSGTSSSTFPSSESASRFRPIASKLIENAWSKINKKKKILHAFFPHSQSTTSPSRALPSPPSASLFASYALLPLPHTLSLCDTHRDPGSPQTNRIMAEAAAARSNSEPTSETAAEMASQQPPSASTSAPIEAHSVSSSTETTVDASDEAKHPDVSQVRRGRDRRQIRDLHAFFCATRFDIFPPDSY